MSGTLSRGALFSVYVSGVTYPSEPWAQAGAEAVGKGALRKAEEQFIRALSSGGILQHSCLLLQPEAASKFC